MTNNPVLIIACCIIPIVVMSLGLFNNHIKIYELKQKHKEICLITFKTDLRKNEHVQTLCNDVSVSLDLIEELKQETKQ